MPFTEAIAVAFASVRAHKLRSFLTVLGVVIGVASVVAIVAITEGLDRYMSEKVLELGTRSFYVQRMPDVIVSREQFLEMQKRKDITLLDVEAVRRACGACREVGAVVTTGTSAKWGRTTQENVQVQGLTENVPRMGAPRDLVAGRPLVQEDIEQARNVAVIGMDLVDAFFGPMEPLDRTINVGGHSLRVIGVGERKGTVFGNSQDNFVWVPITTYRKLWGSRRSVVIQAEARSMDQLEAAQDQARVAMRARRHLSYDQPDDFAIETGESVMQLWQTSTRGIYAVTLVVTAISLVIGGIVVMNIMLVSVAERVHEIGVRKALGARRRDVLRQFLVEAVILTGLGGLLGLLAAAAVAFGLAQVLGTIMSTSFEAPVRPWAVAAALLVSGVVGLVAGIYPANRAASLDPVAALRAD
jgi:putative ABC transport system permease protein